MLKDLRNLLWIIPLAAFLSMPLWKPLAVKFLSPERRETASHDFSGEQPLRISEMSNLQFEQSRNGEQEWLLTAGRLISSEIDADMQLEDVKALFFGAGGDNDQTQIRSRRAEYNTLTKNLTLQGKVNIQTSKGYEMQTESLEYLSADKQIRSTAPVSIHGSNIEVSGKRMVYDMVSGNYSLAGNIVCRIW